MELNNNIAEESFRRMYPDKTADYNFELKYTAKFKPYNANVRKRNNNLIFNLSRSWEGISQDIQIGLVQELLVKLFKEKKQTTEMDLYSLFMKNVHIAVPKTETEPALEESFNRNNEKFFSGMIEKPNLKWGSDSARKLGCYEYGTDTIVMSSIFKNADTRLLDYVMYHEMLHKKLKFDTKNGRSRHHSHHFKEMEAAFPDSKIIEIEIRKLARKHIYFSFGRK